MVSSQNDNGILQLCIPNCVRCPKRLTCRFFFPICYALKKKSIFELCKCLRIRQARKLFFWVQNNAKTKCFVSFVRIILFSLILCNSEYVFCFTMKIEIEYSYDTGIEFHLFQTKALIIPALEPFWWFFAALKYQNFEFFVKFRWFVYIHSKIYFKKIINWMMTQKINFTGEYSNFFFHLNTLTGLWPTWKNFV